MTSNPHLNIFEQADDRRDRDAVEGRHLVRSCATCEHFDGDAHCTRESRLIPGYIPVPALVVCAEHAVKGAQP